jgi:CarD family transcriptional regulator
MKTSDATPAGTTRTKSAAGGSTSKAKPALTPSEETVPAKTAPKTTKTPAAAPVAKQTPAKPAPAAKAAAKAAPAPVPLPSPAARPAAKPKPAAKAEVPVTPEPINDPAPLPVATAAAPEPAPVPEQRPMQQHQRAPMHGGARPQPVRTPSKEERYAEGDYVVYPTHGVGKVEKIAVEKIAGHELELIHITFEENRMTLRVPVAKARTAGLRRLATRKMFDEALAILKGRARVKRTMWSRRAQEYEAKINSGDPTAIAEVVRDLHRNAGQPDQSFSERQIYEAAMDRLAAELAALDQSDKPTAVAKLATFLKAA